MAEARRFRALVRYADGERWVEGPDEQLGHDVIGGRAAVILLRWHTPETGHAAS